MDHIVVAEDPAYHQQTFMEQYNPAFAGEGRIQLDDMPPMALNERKIIARRAAFELRPNSIVNLGIGMPEGLAAVAAEEGLSDFMTLTAEPGVIGGIRRVGLTLVRPSIRMPLLISPTSSISMMAAASTLPSWGSPRPTVRATSMSPASAPNWRGRAALSTSANPPKRWSSSVPSRRMA